MKALFKWLVKMHWVQNILARVAAQYIRLVYKTTTWETEGLDIAESYMAVKKPLLIAFWHGRLCMMPPFWKKKGGIHILISLHQDGILIAKTMRHFGLSVIEGSSSRQGVSALRQIIKALHQRESVVITPDGPRGPAMQVHSAILDIARLTEVPILPVTYAITKARILKSWDRFMFPFPGHKGKFIVAEPIHVPKQASPEEMEAARALLEERLNAITQQADMV